MNKIYFAFSAALLQRSILFIACEKCKQPAPAEPPESCNFKDIYEKNLNYYLMKYF